MPNAHVECCTGIILYLWWISWSQPSITHQRCFTFVWHHCLHSWQTAWWVKEINSCYARDLPTFKFPILKCKSFNFNVVGRPKNFRKWMDCPFKVLPLPQWFTQTSSKDKSATEQGKYMQVHVVSDSACYCNKKNILLIYTILITHMGSSHLKRKWPHATMKDTEPNKLLTCHYHLMLPFFST